jgi:hypothetical protein
MMVEMHDTGDNTTLHKRREMKAKMRKYNPRGTMQKREYRGNENTEMLGVDMNVMIDVVDKAKSLRSQAMRAG